MLVESTFVSLNWEISVSLHISRGKMPFFRVSTPHWTRGPLEWIHLFFELWFVGSGVDGFYRVVCGYIDLKKLVGKRLHEKSSILVHQLNRRQFLCFAMTPLENHLSRTGVMWHWILVSRSLGVRIVTLNWIFEVVFSGIYFSKTWLLWH